MTDGIFNTTATDFWKKGLPIVPANGKAAAIKGWTGYLGSIPNIAKQSQMRETYYNHNIAALMGVEITPEQILIGLDVDDDLLLKLVHSSLGLNREKRRAVLAGKRGKKGATIFVRAPKQLKSTVIKGAAGLGNIDVLAAGKMTIMPPSIHPDTGAPFALFLVIKVLVTS